MRAHQIHLIKREVSHPHLIGRHKNAPNPTKFKIEKFIMVIPHIKVTFSANSNPKKIPSSLSIFHNPHLLTLFSFIHPGHLKSVYLRSLSGVTH